MKTILTLILISFLAIAPHAHAQENEQIFFSTLQDIPLMQGLKEIEEHATSFDKPNGRIIQAFALTNNLSADDITTYYNATLPQFGWGKSKHGHFYRNGENLEISFEKQNYGHILKIMISPSL